MTQRMDEPGLATEPEMPSPPPAAAMVEPLPAGAGPRLRKKSRQTRVVIRKVGPWSVFKLSLLFYSCVMLVVLLALAMLYGFLGAIGAVNHLTDFARNLFADKTFRIHGGWIFARLVLTGAAMVVIWSVINLFIAFLYNLISDVVGGIEVTLAERR